MVIRDLLTGRTAFLVHSLRLQMQNGPQTRGDKYKVLHFKLFLNWKLHDGYPLTLRDGARGPAFSVSSARTIRVRRSSVLSTPFVVKPTDGICEMALAVRPWRK